MAMAENGRGKYARAAPVKALTCFAADSRLNPYEKIGFPTSYREGKEDIIFRDIARKLPKLNVARQTVLEIGPGCSGPAFSIVDLARTQAHHLILVDSDEMLRQLPDAPNVEKITGRFPDQCGSLVKQYTAKIDVAICYTVLHYIFNETNLFDFLDVCMGLLAEGGQILIGDIPNVSKRRRFFSSDAGKAFHREFTKSDSEPEVEFNQVSRGKIDDSVLLALVLRARNAGCDAYLLPQPPELPMANRGEDLLIQEP